MKAYRVSWTNLATGTDEFEGFIEANSEDEAELVARAKITEMDGLVEDEIQITDVTERCALRI